MKSTFMARHAQYLYLIFYLLTVSSVFVTAQEACVKGCTTSSGINQCQGAIPHNETDWSALTDTVQSCYCIAAVKFAGCSPGCSTVGFTADVQGRSFGMWRYVDEVCKSAVDEFLATASISSNTASISPTSSGSTSVNPQTTTSTTTTAPTVGAVSAGVPPEDTQPIPTTTESAPLPTDSALPVEEEHPSSSSKVRTIALSVTLANVGALGIGIALWLLFRRRGRRSQVTQHIYVNGDTTNAMIMLGPDGFPVDQTGPNFAAVVKGGFKSETVKRWIQDQQKTKEVDATTESSSAGFTMWTETDLCPTEMGLEDGRAMEAIREELGEDAIRAV